MESSVPKPGLGQELQLRTVESVERMLRSAVQQRVSDVHLQSVSRGVQIRFRIDGALEDYELVTDKLGQRMINHLKVSADMNVADRRRPQDGRLEFLTEDHTIDLRLATVNSLHGESLAIRVLDRNIAKHDLGDLGLESQEVELIQQILRQPQGLVLVTGPTGAGKTTTLYAMLNQLNDLQKNIITVEEPIEYDLDRIQQIPVDRGLGLGFAECLRAGFRHDPDIIMIGEIRDEESAQIAVRAALSGHLVLSSMHTGSALSAFNALIQHSVSPYMAASALVGVVSQQLIRKNCTICAATYPFSPEVLGAAERADFEKAAAGVTQPVLATSSGCEACRQKGYQHRTGIFEILEVTSTIREALSARASRRRLETLAQDVGWRSLMQSGFSRIVRGVTSIEEVLRVVPTISDPELAHDWKPVTG